MNALKISRRLAKMLRHDPGSFGVTLDRTGAAPLTDVLRALQVYDPELDETALREVVAGQSKDRYEIDGPVIRALYGHSVPVDLPAASEEPPVVLYHGTTPDALESIMAHGLKPMGRRRVHLGVDRDEALRVARRHTKDPVILEVRARDAHRSGVGFRRGNDRIWTADPIPARFLLADR